MGAPARWVLVVDDVAINRKLAKAFFAKLGWQTAEAEGGAAAIDWLLLHPEVDLVLLDIQMPVMSGEEVCRQLRDHPAFADLPIVAYTAHAMQVDIDRFLSHGFSQVLIKPISLQGLAAVIAGLFPE
jgi:CheY-like chemotaxis protein